MQGMSRTSGKPLSSTDHIRQSVTDILSTPLLSRRMLPEYGSNLPELVDYPSDRSTDIRVIMATAVALARWEPRIRVDSINTVGVGAGKISVTIAATDIESGQGLLLEDIEI
ncbi:baseplate assembly protein [Enterobacteriaceae bacterium RIT711]|nr:baseplate assembly protein [Enterobacteriaceae bacterium RIT711]